MNLALLRARHLAAIAAGITAACRPETKAVDTTVTAVPSDTATATATATGTATATASASATVAATATATASASGTVAASATVAPSVKLKCSAPAKLSHQCVPPKSQPPGGGGGPPPPPYSGWDKNGCYPADLLVGTCLGNQAALGPTIEKGQCCYEVCGGLPVPCGRPLLVEGSTRTSRTTPRSDWTREDAIGIGIALCGETKRAWLEDARVEHASIAAFAKLALELLALGAPPDLVAAANEAALEEIEHARICFALAADELGRGAMGPAPLALDGMRFADLATLAAEAASQSCVGETVAGLLLARASERCRPDLRPILAKMSDQELGHAAFGWKLVAWACALGGEPVLARVREALVVGAYSAPVMGDGEDARDFVRDGRWTNDDVQIVLEVVRAHVAEMARALA